MLAEILDLTVSVPLKIFLHRMRIVLPSKITVDGVPLAMRGAMRHLIVLNILQPISLKRDILW
jgi:hypothetical protein